MKKDICRTELNSFLCALIQALTNTSEVSGGILISKSNELM